MTSDCEFGGIIKLYDGLYIAEEFGARDLQSILMNHITHIVNCTVDHTPNFFAQQGIHYLPYRFNQINPDFILLDQSDRIIQEVYNFVQEARQQGQSVLIHGFKEYHLPLVLFTAYLMLKFRWALIKSTQFIERRVGPLPIKGSLLNQLRNLQARFKNKIRGELTIHWQVSQSMSYQQQTINNTYINALGLGKSKPISYQSRKGTKKKVSWKQGPSRAASSKPKKFKSILKVGGQQKQIRQRQRSQKASSSQNIIKQKQKQIKQNSSLDNKSFKLIKDKIQDKLRTTIQLFKNPKQEQRKSRLKSEPAEEQQKKVLVNLTNMQKPPKPSHSSQQIPVKRSLQIKQRVNTEQNIENSSSDITRQIIKKIIFQKNNNFTFKDSSQKDKENQQKQRSKNNSEYNPLKQPKSKEIKFRPSINNFINDSKPYSKPQSPAQRSDKTQISNNITSSISRGKIDLKLKTPFRGFSPMLKDGKKKQMDNLFTSKIFSDGPKRAWK